MFYLKIIIIITLDYIYEATYVPSIILIEGSSQYGFIFANKQNNYFRM